MRSINRRDFLQLSAGAMVTASSLPLRAGQQASVVIGESGETIRVTAPSYIWECRPSEDTFRLIDLAGRVITSGRVQPAIVAAAVNQPTLRYCSLGKGSQHHIESDRVTFYYDSVNDSATVSVNWRFTDYGIFTDPVVFNTTRAENIVSLHYFADVENKLPSPSLTSNYLVIPGLSSSSTISPILRDAVHLDQSVWLGHGSFIPGIAQQWGLPVHYFCGFSIDANHAQRDMFTQGRSHAFTCGLADLPSGDLFLQLYEGKSSLWIDYRSDLWNHMRGPGKLTLGATLFWAVAPDYYDSIAAYYEGLLRAGIIHTHENSARKTAVSLTPQFCTWGVQVERDKMGRKLDESFLDSIYDELKASGMKAGLISIDDKWEGTYGNLVHSTERLPHFEQFLDRLRADGYRIGMWAALMRCERPADLGLTLDNVLKLPNGSPYRTTFVGSQYYILDFTQPAVAEVLTGLARRFMRRYKPDLLKFDFGYELPSVAQAAPQDKQWSGERLMRKGLDIVIRAMREENPDLVVMYYNLSPLFLDYFDIHSPDDLYMASGEYEIEANRRFFFSSLLGPLGIPTYGSSGYDWASAPNIWFDSTAIGTIGSLNDFQKDEQGENSTPERIALYNGLAKVLRPTRTFKVIPLDTVSEAPTRGAHARSWARIEDRQLVLYAYRPTAPGDADALVPQTTDPRINGVLECRMPVVVASKTRDSIDRSTTLALVPFASGEIFLRRRQGSNATVMHHYFGGGVVRSSVVIKDGRLIIPSITKNAEGQPLEWIEINITS